MDLAKEILICGGYRCHQKIHWAEAGGHVSRPAEDLNHRPAFLMCGIEELSPNRFQPRKDFNDHDQKQLVSSIKKSASFSRLSSENQEQAMKSLPENAGGVPPSRPV